MKIILTGAGGLLGASILRRLANKHEVTSIIHKSETSGLSCDIADETQVQSLLKNNKGDIIVHCAAVTDVDFCESNPRIAHNVNCIGTRNLACYSAMYGITFIYISSDYIFDGRKQSPYREDDDANPETVYGISKYGGELYVSYFTKKYYIFRTGLLYGTGSGNWIAKIINKLKLKEDVYAADDQVITPTYAEDFSAALDEFIAKVSSDPKIAYGIYNLTNRGSVTRHGLALKAAEYCGLSAKSIKPAKLDKISSVTPRPKYCALSGEKLDRAAGIKLRAWDEALQDYMTKQ
ncbi:MAG: dTDP-4-dehydrorhamnose reductase [Candidatus Omnitrophica bacterium]|nr:dTDP-4-dehydrorhamnose reductase [Candidatus Omnitrophota bacterium]